VSQEWTKKTVTQQRAADKRVVHTKCLAMVREKVVLASGIASLDIYFTS